MTIAISGTNGITLDGQFNSASSMGFKNRIINGAMVIDQRNAGASQTLTSGGLYSVDRWQTYAYTANLTGQRVTGSLGFKYAYQITGAASNTQAQFQQKIEAANSYDLAGNTVTLSAYFANTANTTVTWVAYYANATDNFSANTIIASGSWTVTSSLARYSTQISIPSAATTGLLIIFYNTGQTSGTWTITGVQLEKGSTATSFDYRPYGTELALCQRYYVQSATGASGTQFWDITGRFSGTTQSYFTVNLPVSMRAQPSISVTPAYNFGGGWYSNLAGVTNYAWTSAPTANTSYFLNVCNFYVSNSATTVGQVGLWADPYCPTTAATNYFAISAEL